MVGPRSLHEYEKKEEHIAFPNFSKDFTKSRAFSPSAKLPWGNTDSIVLLILQSSSSFYSSGGGNSEDLILILLAIDLFS